METYEVEVEAENKGDTLYKVISINLSGYKE